MGKNNMTAVDWYFDKIKSHFEHDGELFESAVWTYEQAKQMEKEQIIKADLAGVERTIAKFNEYLPLPDVLNVLKNIKQGIDIHEEGEQYYNETYAQQ